MNSLNMTARLNNGAHRLTTDSKSYATVANLERAVEKFVAKFDGEYEEYRVRYLVCTTPAGRFYPVFIISEDLPAQLAVLFAHNGFCVMN